MSKKLYGALLPVLAVVAFASISGAAQAAPHWYKCEHFTTKTHKFTDSSCSVTNAKTEGEYELAKLPFEVEGKVTKIPVKTFGKLTLEASNGAIITCLVDDHGRIWNTTEPLAGLDEVQFFENYECVSNFCETGLAVTSSGLPWPTELIAGPPIKDKLGSVANPVKITVTCTKPTTSLLFEGVLEPEFVNGTQANGGVSFANFAKTAGLKSGAITATVTGHDYVIGVETAENIIAKNP
jgi:hypothetical protein